MSTMLQQNKKTKNLSPGFPALLKGDGRTRLLVLLFPCRTLHPLPHFKTFPLAICVKVEEFSKDTFISTCRISLQQKQASLIMT